MSTSASASVPRPQSTANPPAQSTPLEDYELDAAIQASLHDEALAPPRRTRRWSLPDPTKLPELVAAAHQLNSADGALPEPHPPHRRRSMSDFDDLKLRVAHLSHSEFRNAYRLQPASPSATLPRRGLQVTRWRLLNTFFIASFGLYKTVLTYQGQSSAPTTLDWLLGVFWATLSYWVGLLEAEDPALATWLFEEDVWPTARFLLLVISRIMLIYFGLTFPFMLLVLEPVPEGEEYELPEWQTSLLFGMMLWPGLWCIAVWNLIPLGLVVAQFIGKVLRTVKRLYRKVVERGEQKGLLWWQSTLSVAFMFLLFSSVVRFLEKLGAITIDGPAWWIVRAITGGRGPFARPDHVQTGFQRAWDATMALGQGALWLILLMMTLAQLLVVNDLICAHFFPRWWDGKEDHVENDGVPTEDLIDLGTQLEAPAETASQDSQQSPSGVVLPSESRPVVVSDAVVSNCLVVVNLLNRNVPDDRGLILTATIPLSATPRIGQIIAALEKNGGENNEFHRKIRKWGLERTVVAFNRKLQWSLDDARYKTPLAEHTELGRMAALINDGEAVVLPVLDGTSPVAERLRLRHGATETSPIFQVFFVHLSRRATSTSPRAESSSSILPPPATAVTRNRPHQAQFVGAYLHSTYPALDTAVKTVHGLGGFYRRLSRMGATVRLWRSRQQQPVDAELVEV